MHCGLYYVEVAVLASVLFKLSLGCGQRERLNTEVNSRGINL